MATLLQVDRVQYEVNNDEKESLARLYFCNYCLSLKSSHSLQLEVNLRSLYSMSFCIEKKCFDYKQVY